MVASKNIKLDLPSALKMISALKKKLLLVSKKSQFAIKKLKERLKDEKMKAEQSMSDADAQITSLKRELREEISKNASGALPAGMDARAEIEALQKELKSEVAKSTKLEAELAAAKGSNFDARSLKDQAYAEAQIKSLDESLRNEIAKSSRIASDAAMEVATMRETLRREVENAREEIGKAKVFFEAEKVKLVAEIDRLTKALEAESMSLQQRSFENMELKGDIETLLKNVQDRDGEIAKLKTEIEKLNRDVSDRDGAVQNLNLKISELEASIKRLMKENHRLDELLNRYDIINLIERVTHLKEQVEKTHGIDDQKRLSSLLKQIVAVKKQIKIFDNHIREAISNMLNDDTEIEQTVRNRMYTEETQN